MLIDTHCHLDAAEFDVDRDEQVAVAGQAGVRRIVIPAINLHNFVTVRELAWRYTGCSYALGIHPLYVEQSNDKDLDQLREAVQSAMNDVRFIAIGEIGLDYFISGLNHDRQQRFFDAQLRLARDFDLPVLLHVRRSQDKVLQGVRRFGLTHGIAHAFNGSFQQADQFLNLGFVLGFGGAMTFTRALQIRRLASKLPEQAFVLETDSPDIAPQWINHQRNAPVHLARIAEVLADLREQSVDQIARQAQHNTLRVLPRLMFDKTQADKS